MRRRLLVLAAVAVVALVAVRLVVRPTHVMGFREIDDYNIALSVIGASPVWRGLTEQTETDAAVIVAVSHITFQLGAGFGDERIAYIAIRLNEPLGDRQVIDATSNTAVPRILDAPSN